MKRIIQINDLNEIGPALREIRKSKDITLQTAAKSCGVSIATISLIEKSKEYPRLGTLMIYGQYLGIDKVVLNIPKHPN